MCSPSLRCTIQLTLRWLLLFSCLISSAKTDLSFAMCIITWLESYQILVLKVLVQVVGSPLLIGMLWLTLMLWEGLLELMLFHE
uniref:Uncharacterized protein n=1 Tax=Rhizophora mucronata TaxID=61149 RepID=A0A2P2LHW7_RHIMU